MPTDKTQGAGDYEAARDHDDARREFSEAGEVQKAAHDAQPKSQARADDTTRDGAGGKPPSKGEVPGGIPGGSEEAAGPTGVAQPPKGN